MVTAPSVALFRFAVAELIDVALTLAIPPPTLMVVVSPVGVPLACGPMNASTSGVTFAVMLVPLPAASPTATFTGVAVAVLVDIAFTFSPPLVTEAPSPT